MAQAATTDGFGSVFTGNTVAGSTYIEYFDIMGNMIHRTNVSVAGTAPTTTTTNDTAHPVCQQVNGTNVTVKAFCGSDVVKDWGVGPEGTTKALINCNFAAQAEKNGCSCSPGKVWGSCLDTTSGLSFAGASFDSHIVARVRVTAGTLGVGQCDQQISTGLDCVAMDDFFYGEPKPMPSTVDFQGAGDVGRLVSAFTAALGSADGKNNGGSPVNFPDGFRQINWDPAPTINVSDDKQAAFPGGALRLARHALPYSGSLWAKARRTARLLCAFALGCFVDHAALCHGVALSRRTEYWSGTLSRARANAYGACKTMML